ncbi:MAG: DUF4446 family protein [Mediterraneibacter faecis]
MTGVFGNLGIDPFYAFLILLILQVALLVVLVLVYDKYKHLEKVFNTFMKGKNGKSLEGSIFERFDKIDEVVDQVEENREEIAELYNRMKTHYQKVGIVKYDAFHEMGGELSFAITMLDENNTGWILNIMHSRQGCYAYVKDIVKGESTIQLAEEERESLEKAIFQENK